jgi:tetratricopeptide (TPR) repeat protein
MCESESCGKQDTRLGSGKDQMSDRLEQLRRLLDTDPTDAFCLYAIGMEYASLGEHEAAVAHLQQSLMADPQQPYACFQLARALAGLRRPAEAATAIEEGIEIAAGQGDEHAAAELHELKSELRLNG